MRSIRSVWSFNDENRDRSIVKLTASVRSVGLGVDEQGTAARTVEALSVQPKGMPSQHVQHLGPGSVNDGNTRQESRSL